MVLFENGFLFLENGFRSLFCSERAPVTELRSHWTCLQNLFCSNIVTGRSLRFIQSNYNSVTRGQSAIIQGFQLAIGRDAGRQLPHTRTMQRLSPALWERDARRKFASLDSTIETIDWLWQARYLFIQDFPVLQFWCTGNNFFDLQQRNLN